MAMSGRKRREVKEGLDSMMDYVRGGRRDPLIGEVARVARDYLLAALYRTGSHKSKISTYMAQNSTLHPLVAQVATILDASYQHSISIV